MLALKNKILFKYRVICKSLQNFRTRQRTTTTDSAERSISIGRESHQVLFWVIGAVAYLQISPLGDSRDETWRGQGIRKRSVSCNLPKLSQLWRCNGGFGPCAAQNHRNLERLSLWWHATPPPPPPPSWPSRLLYRRGRKSQRDLWITLLYTHNYDFACCVTVSVNFNVSLSVWKSSEC
jgi:hypothetical protein